MCASKIEENVFSFFYPQSNTGQSARLTSKHIGKDILRGQDQESLLLLHVNKYKKINKIQEHRMGF